MRACLSIVLSLTVGAIAALATTQPSPLPGAASAVAEQPATEDVATAVEMPSKPNPSTSLSRIVERRPSAARLGRQEVRVAEPSPLVELRTLAGAKAVFLGDSYTTGWKGAGTGSDGWPAIVGRKRDWQIVNLAVAGTGFLNPGWTGQPLLSRVSAAIKQKPDIVFVAAGHNDSRWSATATARAAGVAIDRLHRALPDAVLVIVAPIWQSGTPPERCLALRDHLRRKAMAVGAIFIDPLGEGWFSGSARRLIGRDGIHPTDVGHRHIAALVLADLDAPDRTP